MSAETACFDLDGTRVHGDPDMSDEARDALRTVIDAVQTQLARETAVQATRYRKRPVVIEAVRLTRANVAEVAEWCNASGYGSGTTDALDLPCSVRIETLEGDMTAGEGDFVIRGVQGEFYPCKPDIFEATYEAVDA